MNTHPDIMFELVRERQAAFRREAREYNLAARLRRRRRSAG